MSAWGGLGDRWISGDVEDAGTLLALSEVARRPPCGGLEGGGTTMSALTGRRRSSGAGASGSGDAGANRARGEAESTTTASPSLPVVRSVPTGEVPSRPTLGLPLPKDPCCSWAAAALGVSAAMSGAATLPACAAAPRPATPPAPPAAEVWASSEVTLARVAWTLPTSSSGPPSGGGVEPPYAPLRKLSMPANLCSSSMQSWGLQSIAVVGVGPELMLAAFGEEGVMVAASWASSRR